MDADLLPMTCTRCGTEFGPDDTHCPRCGVSRAEAQDPPSADEAEVDRVTDASEDSFPASDPPATY